MKPYPFASLNHFTFPLAIRAASCKVIRERRVRLLHTLRAVRDRNVARQNPCQAPRRPSLHRPGNGSQLFGGGGGGEAGEAAAYRARYSSRLRSTART